MWENERERRRSNTVEIIVGIIAGCITGFLLAALATGLL